MAQYMPKFEMLQVEISKSIFRSNLCTCTFQVRTPKQIRRQTQVCFLDQRLSDSLWRQRFSASVLGAFSLAAVGIAMLGVFGATSYLVALRSHEIGVHMAIGASPANILKMVLGQNLVLVAIGTSVGLLGAFALTRVLQGLLFGVNPADSSTLGVVAGVLAISALLACLVPALRAAKVDPIVALRAE